MRFFHFTYSSFHCATTFIYDILVFVWVFLFFYLRFSIFSSFFLISLFFSNIAYFYQLPFFQLRFTIFSIYIFSFFFWNMVNLCVKSGNLFVLLMVKFPGAFCCLYNIRSYDFHCTSSSFHCATMFIYSLLFCHFFLHFSFDFLL